MNKWMPKDVVRNDLKYVLTILEDLPEEDEEDFMRAYKAESVARRIRNYINRRLRDLDKKDYADELADDFDEYRELRVI